MRSKQQKQYKKAKLAYDKANAERKAHLVKYEHLLVSGSDSDIEAHVEAEMEIEASLNYWQLFDELVNAQEAMLDWAFEHIKSDKRTSRNFASNEADLIRLRNTKLPSIRNGLIETCYNLDVTL